jgi:hypothetical protein
MGFSEDKYLEIIYYLNTGHGVRMYMDH